MREHMKKTTRIIEEHYKRASMRGDQLTTSTQELIMDGIPHPTTTAAGTATGTTCPCPPSPPQSPYPGNMFSPRKMVMDGVPSPKPINYSSVVDEKKDSIDETEEEESSQQQAAAANNNNKDLIIHQLQQQVQSLKAKVNLMEDMNTSYFASDHAQLPFFTSCGMPEIGQPASHVLERLGQIHKLDHKPRLNTSSYVNVVTEQEEREAALLGLTVNLADGSVYPASIMVHDNVVNMLARLWHAPSPPKEHYVELMRKDKYCGAGTVGSTEACLLAGLALKFRWRKWYAKRNNITDQEVLGIRPNIVISSCYQAAWEKFFRYFDVEPRLHKPTVSDKFAANAKDMVALCDDKTICVVGILGNHYNGVYDPIHEIDKEVRQLNEKMNYQIGIHVDAASGGFIAPFQVDANGCEPPPFDFRLESVLTISASGHKFGESICGTGWVVFRQREDLAEHIAISVTYLGGKSDSYTLNFSRPASACYVQAYKFLRLGKVGYRKKVANQLRVASFIRNCIRDMTHPDGTPRFQLLDGDDDFCLPVVAARLNPDAHHVSYNDIDLQHALEANHWYVSGYGMGFENPTTHKMEPLLQDVGSNATMFRIVVKSNLTLNLACDLVDHLAHVLPRLDKMNEVATASVIRKMVKFNSRRHILESSNHTESNITDDDSDPDVGSHLPHKAC